MSLWRVVHHRAYILHRDFLRVESEIVLRIWGEGLGFEKGTGGEIKSFWVLHR